MARRSNGKGSRKRRDASPTRKGPIEEKQPGTTGSRREILGVVLLALGVASFLALWSFTPLDRTLLEQGQPIVNNSIGPVGHHIAETLLFAIGIGAFIVAFAFLAGALACFTRRKVHLSVIECAGYLVLMVFGATLAHLALGDLRPFSHAPGGAVGAVAGELLRTWLNTTGALIVSTALVVLALMIASDFTVARLFGTASRGIMAMLGHAVPFLRASIKRAMESYTERRVMREQRRLERIARREARRAEKQAKRIERQAILRLEGEVEADENGIICPDASSYHDPSTKRETPPATKTSSKPGRATQAEVTQLAREGAPEPDTNPKREQDSYVRAPHRAVVNGSRPSASDHLSSDTRGPSPSFSAPFSMAPADELEHCRRASRIDPLEDPTWADPEWVGGLLHLGSSTSEASSPLGGNQPSMELPASPRDLQREASRQTLLATGPTIVTRQDRPEKCTNRGSEPNHDHEAASSNAQEPEITSPQGEESRSPSTETQSLAEAKASAGKESSDEPTIVPPKERPHPSRPKNPSQDTFAYTSHGDKFLLPTLDFLTPPPDDTETELDKEALVETARRLTEKLRDFGIAGEVVQIRPGPVITMYEFRPGPGIKISKIQNLADDLAMAMEALRVRIVAPIPGKNAVGIEVPNAQRQTVCMREILEQDTYLESKSKLTLGMGKNIEGDPVIVDLAKMPHLLIAGTTGSGKSVAVNGMITSMLYKATPDEVRFIMIDPKVLELKLYEGIPHLLLPVVTDPAKAALALRWATEEMDRRYHLLADLNVRDLSTFNRKVTRLHEEWEARQDKMPPLPSLDSFDGDPDEIENVKRRHEERWLADPPPPERLPMLVIVIDELADLMMVASREVETHIARLAQKARAAGIHLLVATQRPSTDVLTGVIKINFPARISFRVASRHDSQTIINEPGAEKLLGNGDMLIIPPGQSEPMRAHGAFLSEGEIERVVEHLKTQGKPVYDETILQPRDDGNGTTGEDDENDTLDSKWDEALAILSERDTISVSWIQRRLAIGYNRAARMIEKMEREGIVGPADGSKPREVLLTAPPS